MRKEIYDYYVKNSDLTTLITFIGSITDENLKNTLKTEKLTTRDSRSVERKKPGRAKARRSYQFSKR